MPLRDTAAKAMEAVEAVTGKLTEHDRARIRDAIVTAMHNATAVYGAENAAIVSAHLTHDPTLVERINEESEMRRKALISNLSSAR